MDLKIDEEFRRLCPPLSDDEYATLEGSIIDEGCREAIITWNGVIIDGHNRYAICTKFGLNYRTTDLSFELDDRDAVRKWILTNQLGRRNLSIVHASYLRGSLYKLIRQSNGGNRRGMNQGATTQDLLAEKFCVSPSTIRNDVQVADALDEMTPDARAFVLNKEATARKQHIIDLSQLSPKSQELVVTKIRDKKVPSLQKAIHKLRPKAVEGSHSVRCKGCGAKLAPGVVTCLKCDLDDKAIAKKLDEDDEEDDTPDDVSDRIADLQAAKRSGDELGFHCDWIIRWCKRNEVDRNTAAHKALHRLVVAARERIGKGKFGQIRERW